MQNDDVALLESLLTENIDNLTGALRSAELAVEVLAARRRRGHYGRRTDLVLADLIDDSRFTVRWNGDECHLGATVLFRLIRRFARSVNHYLTVERLLDDVWGGPRSEAAVRSAIRSLRHKLEQAGMAELAQAIRGQPGHYGLVLEDVAAGNGSHRDRTAIAPPTHRSSR